MAPLRFRAWHKEGSEMFPVEILVTYEEPTKTDPSEDGEVFPPESKVSYFFPSQVIVMQSTGLKDKNGKEIFEGDVVSKHCTFPVYNRIGIVQFGRDTENTGMWERKTVRFSSKASEGYNRVLQEPYYEPFGLACGHLELEVIGNIYENPDLLKPNPSA